MHVLEYRILIFESGLVWFCFAVFNATFNNISVISWRSVLLMEETGGPGENHRSPQVTDKIYHIMLYTSPWAGVEPTTSVVISESDTNTKFNINLNTKLKQNKRKKSWATKIRTETM